MNYGHPEISGQFQFNYVPAGVHSAMSNGFGATNVGHLEFTPFSTNAEHDYFAPQAVHPKMFHMNQNPNMGYNQISNSFAHSAMNNAYSATNAGRSHMFYANANAVHNLSQNSSTESPMNNGYLTPHTVLPQAFDDSSAHTAMNNGSSVTNAGHPQMLYENASAMHNLRPNFSTHSTTNNCYLTPYSVHPQAFHANAPLYCQPKAQQQKLRPRPAKEIVFLSVEETADWIYELGKFEKWDWVNHNSIRRKFSQNNIDGKKIMQITRNELKDTCNIEKLGHRLVIEKVVKQEVDRYRNYQKQKAMYNMTSNRHSAEAIPVQKSGRGDEVNVEMKRCQSLHVIVPPKEKPMIDTPLSSKYEAMCLPSESRGTMTRSSFSIDRVLPNSIADVTSSKIE